MGRMVDDYPDRAEERDEIFVRQVVSSARSIRSEFREWIQQELNDLIYLAQLAEAISGGVVKDGIREDLHRLEEMNRHGLGGAIRVLDEEIERVNGGAYGDVLDAYHYLQDTSSRLERFMRQLLEIKQRLSTYTDSGPSE